MLWSGVFHANWCGNTVAATGIRQDLQPIGISLTGGNFRIQPFVHIRAAQGSELPGAAVVERSR